MRYPCKYCMKWFRGNYIKLHMMRHMGTLPHVCKICAKQFPFNSNLKVHFRRKHGFEWSIGNWTATGIGNKESRLSVCLEVMVHTLIYQ
jgi:hypothetical protein